ncbi:ABC transporter, ATP-binding/permease protein [Alteracholeplasma palmae J233]|uniref:ABC transporter, ATP-binding/permease protein n=1 Tax=Alteracholeplasma palmae (strain ATCC 49389 / J233) TaxID=1318466 RepID=U4KKR2_ALTPJ|nr:ABC transporter ATP-binding protein [Alteracholeplasma palmae]CCV64374.1 ABC transporter, ATP-binding/permease protein [Alteracholeplasma palmae J233]
MKLILAFIKKNKLLVIMTFLLLIIQLITILYIPYLVAHIVDDGILKNDLNVVIRLGIEMGVVAIIGVVVSILCSYYSAVTSTKFGTFLRLSIFEHIQKLSINEVENYGTSAFVSRITSDVVNIQQVVIMLFQMILHGPVIGIVAVIMSFGVSIDLGYIALATVGTFMLVAVIVTWISFRYLNDIQKFLDKMMLVLREFFVGVRIIRAFDNSKYEKERTNKTFEDHADNMKKINKLFAWLSPIAYATLGFSMMAILWVGLFDVQQGAIPIGEVTAVIEYTTLAILTLVMAALVIVMIPRAYAALKRVEYILDLKPTVNDPIKSKNKIKEIETNILVKFEHVHFDYDGKENYALDGVNFDIKKGETVAIIGATGSGKSTVAKLLLKLHNISKGAIYLDGLSIEDLKQDDIRDKISYVPQKAFLFTGTIRDNVKFHNKDVSDELMIKAAKVAQADDFIQSLDHGYDSVVARGGQNFSGGQKQRISIARALCKPADLYIFDDSFSALDYKTDAKLRMALKEEFSEKTLLIIAQRVSTIMHADKIIVMDKGTIIGIGKHEELIKNNQTYQDFAKSQHIKVGEE